MKRIFKYEIPGNNWNVKLPTNAKILTVNEQNGSHYLWAIVDTQEPLEKRKIITYVTGGCIMDVEGFENVYIGTIFRNDGFVFHTFEQRRI